MLEAYCTGLTPGQVHFEQEGHCDCDWSITSDDLSAIYEKVRKHGETTRHVVALTGFDGKESTSTILPPD